jgi:epoxyqueuosine reductase
MESHLPTRGLPGEETEWIRQQALAAGFDLCGVASAEKFPDLERYPEWLARGYGGEMKYLDDERRMDPLNAMQNVRSVIVCGLNYNSELPFSTDATEDTGRPRGWISRYAWGDDYHEVLWGKLNHLAAEMRAHFTGPFELRAYADTGPIHERAAAKHAGLGWIGKHTLLINSSQKMGSWFFLGVILTTLPLSPTLGKAEPPPADRCGTCTRCIDACPTQAIVEPYVLDASRCISYLTIEKRGSIPEEFREAMGPHIFGCDICQDVCPWNRKSPRTDLQGFQPRSLPAGDTAAQTTLFQPDLLRIASLSEEEFRTDFRGSPIKRTKWRGLVRNACIALGNVLIPEAQAIQGEAVAVLRRLTESEDFAIKESAEWALSRIQNRVANREGGEHREPG